ncbi:hypothetical protein M422DRAFT_68177 [Sphaerobolus stellatus SS14]|uniref:Uncharacterized protein n=1 Tax=Sphaerobolus stellatus (strain SS14) TaxID=990650 RepID=A0A0C9VT15_SPHS4|nr:hypothetical protein M422DRAFT_68177 [Sphaerobolus stellatus SS14]
MTHFHSNARFAEKQMDWIIHFDWFTNKTKCVEIEKWLNNTQTIRVEIDTEFDNIKAGVEEDELRFEEISRFAFDASEYGVYELTYPIYCHLLRALKYSRLAWFEYHEGKKVLDSVHSIGLAALKEINV